MKVVGINELEQTAQVVEVGSILPDIEEVKAEELGVSLDEFRSDKK